MQYNYINSINKNQYDSGFFIHIVYSNSFIEKAAPLSLQYLKTILSELNICIDDADVMFQTENDDGIPCIARIQRCVTALFHKLLRFIDSEIQPKAEHDHLITRDIFRRLARGFGGDGKGSKTG